jgi:hypothetical protein
MILTAISVCGQLGSAFKLKVAAQRIGHQIEIEDDTVIIKIRKTLGLRVMCAGREVWDLPPQRTLGETSTVTHDHKSRNTLWLAQPCHRTCIQARHSPVPSLFAGTSAGTMRS